MKQMNYFYEDGTMYHVFKCSGEIFVHTEIEDDLVIGRGQTFEEAINEVKHILNKQYAPYSNE